jgi:hypothetical protein
MANLDAANAMDIIPLGVDAALSLKLLYTSFIQGGNITNAVDGTRRIGAIPAPLKQINNLSTTSPPSTSSGSLVVDVLTDAAFNAAYPDALFYNATPLNGNIYQRAHNAQVYTVITSHDDIPITNIRSTDVNVYTWLVAQGGELANLSTLLRDMKVAYQLLDDGIYTSMMAQSDPTKLSILPPLSHTVYDIQLKAAATAGQFSLKVVNDPRDYGGVSQESAFDANVNNLSYFVRTLDPITQDIFAIRRVILATYLMAHARLFSRMYFALRTPPSGLLNASNNAMTAGKLAHYYYSRLLALNISYESSRLNMDDNATAANDTITQSIIDNVYIYTDNTKALSKINDDMGVKRRTLVNEISRVKTESRDAGFSKRLVIAAIILAFTLLMVLFVVFVMPVDVQVRIKVASLVMAMALVVVAVLVFLQKRNIHEGFRVTTGGLNVSFEGSLEVTARDDLEKLMKMIDLVFTEELRNFYRYTVEITLLLKNNRLYNELNYNTSKERNWFENNQYQLNKNIVDAKTARHIYDRKTKISTALLRFVLQVLVIVAFVVLGIAAVQDAVPILVNVIYVIGGILFVLSVFYLFGDILRRTYIDADRLYWGTPAAVKDL